MAAIAPIHWEITTSQSCLDLADCAKVAAPIALSTPLVKGSIRRQLEGGSWDVTAPVFKGRTADEVLLAIAWGRDSEEQPVVKDSKATVAALWSRRRNLAIRKIEESVVDQHSTPFTLAPRR